MMVLGNRNLIISDFWTFGVKPVTHKLIFNGRDTSVFINSAIIAYPGFLTNPHSTYLGQSGSIENQVSDFTL